MSRQRYFAQAELQSEPLSTFSVHLSSTGGNKRGRFARSRSTLAFSKRFYLVLITDSLSSIRLIALMLCSTIRRISRRPSDLISIQDVTLQEFRSKYAISVGLAPYAKSLSTNTFTDNKYIFYIVILTTTDLCQLYNLIFICFFVPILISASFKRTRRGSWYYAQARERYQINSGGIQRSN